MTDADSHSGIEQGGDPLEQELAALTKPVESTELYASAWDQVNAERAPRVIVLRRWLAPMAVAATLVLVGLTATTLWPSGLGWAGRNAAVNGLAMAPPQATVPEAGRGFDSRSRESDAKYRGADRALSPDAPSELATGTPADQIGKSLATKGGTSKESDYKDAAEKAEKQASAAEGSDRGEESRRDAQPKLKQAEGEKSQRKAAAPDGALPAGGAGGAAEKGEREKAEAQAPAPQTPAKPEAPPAPVTSENKSDQPLADKNQDAKNVPVPGAPTASQRAAGQFQGAPMHQDAVRNSAPSIVPAAPGPVVRGELNKLVQSGGTGGAPAEPTPTVGWAQRVFVQRGWWWAALAGLGLAVALVWRARVRAAAREPGPLG